MTTTIYGNKIDFSIKKSIEAQQPKIYGLGFPIGKTTKSNKTYFNKDSGIELIKSNITQLLSTYPGERIMLPNYGLDLRQYLFEPLDSSLFAEIKEQILITVGSYLPSVEIIKLQVISLDEIGYSGIAGLKITIQFRVKNYQNLISDVTLKVGG